MPATVISPADLAVVAIVCDRCSAHTLMWLDQLPDLPTSCSGCQQPLIDGSEEFTRMVRFMQEADDGD